MEKKHYTKPLFSSAHLQAANHATNSRLAHCLQFPSPHAHPCAVMPSRLSTSTQTPHSRTPSLPLSAPPSLLRGQTPCISKGPTPDVPRCSRLKAPQRPDVARESASFEKVENVVKPPQSPTVSASCKLLLQLILEPNPPRSPIAKLPMTLIATVAQGKKHDGKINPITYRNRSPNLQPKISKCNSLSCIISLPAY